MKPCRECKYLLHRDGRAICTHESAAKRDFVTGEHDQYSCYAQRFSILATDCGKDGKHWEAKEDG